MIKESPKENIQVVVRIKPLSSKDISAGLKSCVKISPSDPRSVIVDCKPESKIFTFDKLIPEHCNQESLYSQFGYDVCEYALKGYNVCIFCYGQTGAGKTFTLIGKGLEKDSSFHKERGLQPRMHEKLFELVEREQNFGNEFTIKGSHVEIYKEQLNDLVKIFLIQLSDTHLSNPSLQIREDIKKGVFIEALTEETITTADEATDLLRRGLRNRHIGATAVNKNSSRSHSVFTFTIQSKKDINGLSVTKTSKFHFVDLAGSERQKDTLVTGERFKEACNINKSLTILGLVINSLVDTSLGRSRHIPYRDSKLTFLLKDSLGGNSKTCMIANVSSCSSTFHETLSTLKFAQRTKLIRNKVSINEETSGSVEILRSEIKRLKESLFSNKFQLSNVLESSEKDKWIMYIKSKMEEQNLELTYSIEDSIRKVSNDISNGISEARKWWQWVLMNRINNPGKEVDEMPEKLMNAIKTLEDKEEQIETVTSSFKAMRTEIEGLKNILSISGLGTPEQASFVLHQLKDEYSQKLVHYEMTIQELRNENKKLMDVNSWRNFGNNYIEIEEKQEIKESLKKDFQITFKSSTSFSNFLAAYNQVQNFQSHNELHENHILGLEKVIEDQGNQISLLLDERTHLYKDFMYLHEKILAYEDSCELELVQGLEEDLLYYKELAESLAVQEIKLTSNYEDAQKIMENKENQIKTLEEQMETIEQSYFYTESELNKKSIECHKLTKAIQNLEQTIIDIKNSSIQNSNLIEIENYQEIRIQLFNCQEDLEKLKQEKADDNILLENIREIELELRTVNNELETKLFNLQNNSRILQKKLKEKSAESLEFRRLLWKAKKNENYYELIFNEEKALNKQTKKNLDKFKTSKNMLQRQVSAYKKQLAYEEKRREEDIAKMKAMFEYKLNEVMQNSLKNEEIAAQIKVDSENENNVTQKQDPINQITIPLELKQSTKINEEISIFALNKENAKNEQAKIRSRKKKILTEFSELSDSSDIFEGSRKRLKLQ